MNQLPTDLLKSLQMANEQNTTSQPQQQLPHQTPMFAYPPHPMQPMQPMQPYPHMMMDPSMVMMGEGGMFDESQILEEIKKLQNNNGQSTPPSEESIPPTTNTTVSGNTITRQDTPVPESKPISSHKARTEYILNQANTSQLSPTSPSEVDVNNNSPSHSPTSLSSSNVINNGSTSPSSSSIQKYVTNPQSMIDPFITGPIDKKAYTYVTSSLDAKKERKQLASIKGITPYVSDQIFTNGKCIGILDDYMVWSLKGGAIRVVSRKVGKKVFLKGHKQYVSDLQCSVNLKLASVSRDRSLIVWKIIETDEKIHPNDLRNPKEDQVGYAKLVHLTFSSDQSHRFFRRILWAPQSDKELCAITSDNQLILLDVDQLAMYNNLIELDNDNIHTMRGIRVLSNEFAENESITDLSFSSDGKYLACISSFGNIYIWDRRTNMTLVKSANIYNNELINIQFCSGTETNIERYFITSSQNNFDICLWYLSPKLDIELVQQVSIRPETSEKFDEKVSINNVELDSTASALFVSNLQYPVLFTLRLNKTPLTEQEDHPHFDFITEFDCRYPIVSLVAMTIGINFGLFCLQTSGIHLLNIRNFQICALSQQVKTAIPMPDLVHQPSSSKEIVVANTNTGVAIRQSPNIIPPVNPSVPQATPTQPASSGSNFELISELKRMERSILTQMETMIQTQTERQYEQLYKRIEKERLTRLSEERTRQKELIETISSAITNDLPDEISQSVLDSLTDNMSDVVNDALTQSLTDTSDSGSIKKVIQDSFQTVLKSTVLPSFETSCRRMFEQISKTFERGMDELVKSPLKQYCKEVNDSTVEAIRQELKNVAQNMPAVQQTATNTSNNNGDISKEQLLNLVENQRFEEVFSLVLEKADLRLLVWLCSVIDPRLFEVDIPISQPILLTLVQQLAYDITEQTDVKLSWLERVIIHINPIDPAISQFSAPILEGIREHLAAKHPIILERGKPSDIKTIKLILHIVNSLTKDAIRF